MQHTAFIAKGTPENSRAIPGALFHFLANGNQTGNSFSLIYIEVHKGNEPPAHVHQNEDESYYILEGSIRFFVGDQVLEAHAGDFIHLPKGVPHRFELISKFVKELMWITSSGLEKWFWEHSAPAPDMQAVPIATEPPPAAVLDHFVLTLSQYGVEMVR